VRSELKVLRALEEIRPLKADWTSLSVRPEQNWDLYWNSIRNQTPARSPYVVSLLHDNRLQVALGGWIERGAVDLHVGYWTPLHVAVRRIVIPMRGLLGRDDEATSRRMIEGVIQDLRQGRADVARFEFLEEGSPLLRAIRSVPLGFRMRDHVPERRIHRYLNLPATFDEYQRVHKGLMQKVRKFEQAFRGRYEYRLLTRAGEVDAFCDGADAVARKTYQRALGVGFLNNAKDRRRLEGAARHGVWRAFVALVDGKTVAFWCGCQFESTVSLWWTGYDTEFQEYSPGLVASARMIELSIQRGVSVVDFGGGDAPYKERLANESRWEESVCVFAPTLRGSLANGVRAVDMAIGNLTRTKLKGLASRVKTPWRHLMAKRMSRCETAAPPKGNEPRNKRTGGPVAVSGRPPTTGDASPVNARRAWQVGNWVEVRSLDQILATLDGEGKLDGLPFMPEMVRHCGRHHKVQAVMTKICVQGKGMRAVFDQPLVLLDQLRCDGALHGLCSRACTLLWKPAWLRSSCAASEGFDGAGDEARAEWPHRTQEEGGAYVCQATALKHATLPISTTEKVRRALADVREGEWSLGSLVEVYAQTLSDRVGSLLRRLWGAIRRQGPTPVETLALQPGEWAQVKPLKEILATLDRNNKNRGLMFSRYMIPFCGGTYRVTAKMDNFIDDKTGDLRKFQNTVLLEGVSCGGETTSGPCRRAEYLYWREIWLRRANGPPDDGRSLRAGARAQDRS